MLVLILPGYSLHNKEWSLETAKYLKEEGGCKVLVHEWEHWKTGKTMNINREAEKIIQKIGNKKVSFIAKSVGTRVFIKIYPKIEKQLDKVILCGIPIDPVRYMNGIKIMGSDRLIIFQNSHDPFMSHRVISIYVKLINKNIKVIKKEASTHDYPYYDDFLKFLDV